MTTVDPTTCDHDAYEVTAICEDCGTTVPLPPDPYDDHLRELADILDVEIPENLHPQTVWEHIIDHLRDWVREQEADPGPRMWSLPSEPGPEVKAVRCMCCQRRWVRVVGQAPHPDDPQPADLWAPFGSMLSARTWRALVADHSEPEFPLTDVSGEA